MSEWGGSGIEKVTYDYISNRISHGSTFVELGAGKVSTREFSKLFNLYSVENNLEYCGICSGANYIHAPIKNGWYDIEALKIGLPKNISGIFVDGPAGTGNRNGFLHNIDLFDMTDDVVIIVHDTHREEELKLAQNIASKLEMKISLFTEGDYFAVLSRS